MIHLAPLLGRLVGVISAGGVVILGDLGLFFRFYVLGLFPTCPLHGCSSRYCSVDRAPIGSQRYATAVEFFAHLRKAGGFSQNNPEALNIETLLLFLSPLYFLSFLPSFFLPSAVVGRGLVSSEMVEGWSKRLLSLLVPSWLCRADDSFSPLESRDM